MALALALPVVAGNTRMGVPYIGIGKLVAIGLNYSDHVKEANQAVPSEPVVFMKTTTCISGPNSRLALWCYKGANNIHSETVVVSLVGAICHQPTSRHAGTRINRWTGGDQVGARHRADTG